MDVSEKKPVAVLGANGFIGRHVVSCLTSDPKHQVIATAVKKPDLAQDISCISEPLDCTDTASLESFFERNRPKYLINCAAYGVNPQKRELERCFQINALAPAQAFRLFAKFGGKRFVHIGTCEEYGRHKKPCSEDSATEPEGPYATTKLAGTLMLQEAARTKKTELVIVRPFGTWGPGEMRHRLVPTIIFGCIRQEKISLSDGEQLRDFALVSDVAKAIVAMVSANIPSQKQIINIGSGQYLSVREFALRVARALNCENLLEFGRTRRRSNEMQIMLPEVQLLNDYIGWVPKGFDEEALDMMLDEALKAHQGFARDG